MANRNYDIDDILLEAQQLKKQAQPNRQTSPKGADSFSQANALAEELVEAKKSSTIELHQQELAAAPLNKTQPFSIKQQLVDAQRAKAEREQQQEEPLESVARKPLMFRRKPEDQKRSVPETPAEDDFSAIDSFESAPPFDNRVAPPKKQIVQSAPAEYVQPPPPMKPRRVREAGNQKRDLFDFHPEQRVKPFKQGAFGQKQFDFQKPVPVKPDESGFDFGAVSEKIDQMNPQKNASVRGSKNFFDNAVHMESIADRAQSRSHYADLAAGKYDTVGRFRFRSSKTGQLSSTLQKQGTAPIVGTEQEPNPLFSTLGNSTGRELKLEDIRRMDFGTVEGSRLYDDEDLEADDLPDGHALDFNEYGPTTDRRDIARDIAGTKMSLFIRTALTGLLTIILLYLSFAARYEIPVPGAMLPDGSTLGTYLIFCTALIGVVGVVCGNTILSGLIGLGRMRANSDTLASLAIFGCLVQGFAAMRNTDLLEPLAMSLFFPVAALAMFFNCLGKLIMVERIQQNFKITASRQKKCSVQTAQSAAFCQDVLPNLIQRKPTISFGVAAEFFTDYMALSFSNKYDVGIHRAVAPVCLLGAFVVAAITWLLADAFAAASAFAGILCICAAFSSTFIENVPLLKLSQKLVPMGAMVSGNKAVESFCDTDAVVLTENDLFPKGHVYLNGIKAFPNGRIDEAILDAASVLCALNGSLSTVFLDMIGGNRALLKKVDNVVYENSMGLSGWVDGRRVLIGSRTLMQNHGVILPHDSYEKANPSSTPGNPIYLSNTGEVSARFLLEYLIDEELAYQLDLFAAKEKQLVVYTTDVNIDAMKISELYSYPIDLITIMPSELQDDFREMSEPRKEVQAEIVYTGKPASLVAAILAAINARASILTATIVMLVQTILGYGIVALMAFMGNIGTFSMVKMVIYQLFWFVAVWVIQQTRKP